MIHPSTELRFIDPAIGYGVFATERIPLGTIVWTLDCLDRVMAPADIARLPAPAREVVDRYTFVSAAGDRVLCWDHAKFVNHSCRANCLSPGLVDLEIAVRDIEAGEELTDDYGSLNLECALCCACGWPECRETIGPGDFDRLTDLWDGRLRRAIAFVGKVEQPLWDWLPDAELLHIAASNPDQMASIRNHAYRQIA